MIEPENNEGDLVCENSVVESNSTYIFHKILVSNSYDIGQKVQNFFKEFTKSCNLKMEESLIYVIFLIYVFFQKKSLYRSIPLIIVLMK